MKKIYLSMFMSAIMFGAGAQEYRQLVNKYDGNVHTSNSKPTQQNVNLEKAAVIWSDDFSTPSNWTMTNTSAPISWDWTITTTQSDIPNAAPSLQPFASSTANNGFALINSDGQPGNADGDGAIVAEITNSTPIDLSLYPNVILRYQHSYRWWHDTRGVRVSGNGGATWTDFEVTDVNGYPNDQNSENPVYEVINISSVAGGSNNVLIQFYYNDNDYWAWYWVVDDVEILEQPNNDIQVLGAWFAGSNNGGVEYGRTPTNHLDASFAVGTEVFNFGVNDQTNILTDADYTSFTYNSGVASILANDTAFIETTETPSLSVGLYQGVHTAVSDLETGGAEFGNNMYERNFEVTTDVYSLDGIGIYPTSTADYSVIGTSSFVDSDDGMVVAGLYNIKQSDMVSGIRVMLDPATTAGGDIYGSILDTADFWQSTMTALYTTTPGQVTATDITNGYIDLWFPSVITLAPGAYYAGVELYSNAGANPIVIIDDQTVPQPFDASAIYISGDQSYTNGTAIGIRMLMGNGWGVGLDEETLSGISIYPNPSTGLVNVSNDENMTNTITVRDLNGRLVLTQTTSMAATLDLTGVETGVYTVTVENEAGQVTDRVVIK